MEKFKCNNIIMNYKFSFTQTPHTHKILKNIGLFLGVIITTAILIYSGSTYPSNAFYQAFWPTLLTIINGSLIAWFWKLKHKEEVAESTMATIFSSINIILSHVENPFRRAVNIYPALVANSDCQETPEPIPQTDIINTMIKKWQSQEYGYRLAIDAHPYLSKRIKVLYRNSCDMLNQNALQILHIPYLIFYG